MAYPDRPETVHPSHASKTENACNTISEDERVAGLPVHNTSLLVVHIIPSSIERAYLFGPGDPRNARALALPTNRDHHK